MLCSYVDLAMLLPVAECLFACMQLVVSTVHPGNQAHTLRAIKVKPAASQTIPCIPAPMTQAVITQSAGIVPLQHLL